MEAPAAALAAHEGARTETFVLVWIDARSATVARWVAGEVALERLVSDVPAHHKSTGHVGHDPSIRHGGGGRQQNAVEMQRVEHLNRFVEEVAARLPATDTVAILGPGKVRDHLERVVRDDDTHHHRQRLVTSEAAARLTERQLIARVRTLAGDAPPRHTVGAYRQAAEPAEKSSGAPAGPPERLTKKPAREKVRLADELAVLDDLAAKPSDEDAEAADLFDDDDVEPSDDDEAGEA